LIVRAAIVPSPPLLARGLTGRAEVLPELRAACAAAVARLLSASADVVAVVGSGTATATFPPGERLNVAAFGARVPEGTGGRPGQLPGGTGGRPPGRQLPVAHLGEHSPPRRTRLPLAVGIGAELLDEAGYAGPRALESVDAAATAQECARVGARVAGLASRVSLLVVGDGSARRTPSAPGHFDERAEAFDDRAEAAIRAGDMAGLAGLDAGLAAELMATGRAAWQVLAGAAGLERRAPGEVLYSDAPFGVSYLVAVLDVR
jgi:hypothetical protein